MSRGRTIVFGSLSSGGSQLRFAAALRRRGYRVENISASGERIPDRIRALAERIVFHRVERSLGTSYSPSAMCLEGLGRALEAGPLDMQLDDWLAAAMAERYGDHAHFRRRTRAPFRELDIYDKFAMTEHAAASGWAVPTVYATSDDLDDVWPKIVKPRLGSAGYGIHIVHDAAECRRGVEGLGGWPAVIVEQFIQGPSVRVAGIARDGHIIHGLTYRTVKAADDPYGPSTSLAVVEIPDLLDRARALLGPIGYTGIFGIESLCGSDGVPRFIEMNTRILASFAALSGAGVDLVDDYLYAMGARAKPANGRVRETIPLRVNSIRLLWRALGLRWVTVELLLRLRPWLGQRKLFAGAR